MKIKIFIILLYYYYKVIIDNNWDNYTKIIKKAQKIRDTKTKNRYDFEKIKSSVYNFTKYFIIFFPYRTICIQRAVVAYICFAHFGFSLNFISGVKVKPYKMHCWLEYNDNIVFDSPRESMFYANNKKIRIDKL